MRRAHKHAAEGNAPGIENARRNRVGLLRAGNGRFIFSAPDEQARETRKIVGEHRQVVQGAPQLVRFKQYRAGAPRFPKKDV